MNSDITIPIISPLDLKTALCGESPPLVLDVRELSEIDICALPTYVHIPLGDILENSPDSLEQLPTDRVIVTVCHHGYRSLRAAYFLNHHGFEKVVNLEGGIDAWADQIDSTMARY